MSCAISISRRYQDGWAGGDCTYQESISGFELWRADDRTGSKYNLRQECYGESRSVCIPFYSLCGAQEITIQPSQDTNIELNSQIAMNDAPVEVYRKGAYYQPEMWDHVLGVRSDRCKLGIAVVGGGDGVRRVNPGTFAAEGSRGKSHRFWILAALVPEYYSDDPEQQACRMVQRAVMVGYDDLRAENRRQWEQLWRSRIRVSGDAEGRRRWTWHSTTCTAKPIPVHN